MAPVLGEDVAATLWRVGLAVLAVRGARGRAGARGWTWLLAGTPGVLRAVGVRGRTGGRGVWLPPGAALATPAYPRWGQGGKRRTRLSRP